MIVIALLGVILLLYVGWRISTAPVRSKPADTQPIAPPTPPPPPPESPFTPLANFLAEHDAHFKDETALQPPPRALPHVQKRKGKK